MSIHPEILSLQRLKDQARDEIKKSLWEDLLLSLWCWNVELKEVDQDKGLIDKIDKEQITLRGFRYPGGKTKRIKERIKKYKEWYTKTLKQTWDKGYFENKKYGPVTTKDSTFKDVKPWNEQ